MKNNVDIIARGMAANAARGVGGEGSALPTVTTADNGKVMSVVSGAWDAALPQKDYLVKVEKVVVANESVDVTTLELDYYIGYYTGEFDYESIQYDGGCIVKIGGGNPYTMPIHYYEDSDYMVIGEWDTDNNTPIFDHYDFCFYIGLLSSDTPDKIVYTIFTAASMTILIEKQPVSVDMTEDFLIASEHANSLVMVCPPQVVTMENATAEYNPNGYIDKHNVLTYISGSSQTYVYIDGIRATYAPEYNGWYITGESCNYLLYPYQIPQSVSGLAPPQYLLVLVENRPGYAIHENHSVSVWLDDVGVGAQLGNVMPIHISVRNGDVATDATYDFVRACTEHHIPILADINGIVCTIIPNAENYYQGDDLVFKAMEFDPSANYNLASMTVHTVYVTSSNEWWYEVSGCNLQIAEDIVT